MPNDDPKGSFVRWQSITIAQLGYAINLILGFSVATFGFQITLLLDNKFNPISYQKFVFFISVILIFASLSFGIWAIINRLLDFRATKNAARKKEEKAPEKEIESYRIRYRKLGPRTWRLFWLQVGTFGAGVLFTILSVLASVIHKLL